MSVHVIYYRDGAKMMRPVLTREEYLALRGSEKQQCTLKAVRQGDAKAKTRLVQMNYSCLPNEDGTLRGSARMTTTVGMDIDHVAESEMQLLKERILEKRHEMGLMLLERSARGEGYHLVFRRREGLTQEENLRWASELLGVEYDAGAKDITRVFFTTTADAEELPFLSDEIFELAESKPDSGSSDKAAEANPMPTGLADRLPAVEAASLTAFDLCARQAGLNAGAMDVWGEHNWHTNLMAVLSVGVAKLMSRQQLMAVVAERLPNYSQTDDCRKLIDYFYDKYDADRGFMNASLREINAMAQGEPSEAPSAEDASLADEDDAAEANTSLLTLYAARKKLPQGVRESIEAVGPQLAMPAVVAICPCIGALATGVVLDVHGRKRGLNLISYIAGDFASGKGNIDPVVDAWMGEVVALDKMYQAQEEEWRQKKRAAKNKTEQPEEPKLPVRCLPLNNTVANLAERLANTDGKHAFSFTPEADTVAQKWKTSMSDFSVMLRQSYDGSRYDREARSAEAVNVHIEHLLWNVTMCGTPDALYRVVTNYTDGFQSRIAVARTPDNTYAPLEENPYVLTPKQT